MTKEDWKTIDNFTPKEKWGDPYKMDYRLLLFLDKAREHIGKEFIIHCGYEEREKGFHPEGMAVDFHVKGMGLYTAWEHLNKMWWFGGLGIYPYWNSPGFHADIGGFRRWRRDKNGIYLPI